MDKSGRGKIKGWILPSNLLGDTDENHNNLSHDITI